MSKQIWHKKSARTWVSDDGMYIIDESISGTKMIFCYVSLHDVDKGINFYSAKDIKDAKAACQKLSDTAIMLEVVELDNGNCRAYVKCEKKFRYVILDQGEAYQKACLPRFELHTHSKDGEPDCPIKKSVPWIIVKCDAESKEFKLGVSFIGGEYEPAP